MLITLQDLRIAARRIGGQPGFAAATVLALAIGIGGATFVFSTAHQLLAQSVPYGNPARLAVVWPAVASWEVFEQVRDTPGVFDGVGVCSERGMTLSGDGRAIRVLAARVSESFLPVIDVTPALGRGFRKEDWNAGGSAVVLLADALWRERYGASRDIVGHEVRLDGRLHTVVGVLPPGFGTVSELRVAREGDDSFPGDRRRFPGPGRPQRRGHA